MRRRREVASFETGAMKKEDKSSASKRSESTSKATRRPSSGEPKQRSMFRASAEGLSFEALPKAGERKLFKFAGETIAIPAELSEKLWERTARQMAHQPIYCKPEGKIIRVNGVARPEKGEVQGVAIVDFNIKDVSALLGEVKGGLGLLNEIAKWHPDSEVWKAACRCMADIAFMVLRQRPDSDAIQDPFHQLWNQRQSDFCGRWQELVERGQRRHESLGNDPVRRVLFDAAMTVKAIFSTHIIDVARFMTEPKAIDDLLARQALSHEEPVETLENGLRLDRICVLIRGFLCTTPGFPEQMTPVNKRQRMLINLPMTDLQRFEKTVMRPYLTDGGDQSVWNREVKPVLVAHGAKPFPGSHAKTMISFLEADYTKVSWVM